MQFLEYSRAAPRCRIFSEPSTSTSRCKVASLIRATHADHATRPCSAVDCLCHTNTRPLHTPLPSSAALPLILLSIRHLPSRLCSSAGQVLEQASSTSPALFDLTPEHLRIRCTYGQDGLRSDGSDGSGRPPTLRSLCCHINASHNVNRQRHLRASRWRTTVCSEQPLRDV